MNTLLLSTLLERMTLIRYCMESPVGTAIHWYDGQYKTVCYMNSDIARIHWVKVILNSECPVFQEVVFPE